MLKQKKAKILASILCATVAAGLYTAPVMADDPVVTGLTVDGSNVKAEENVAIKEVTTATIQAHDYVRTGTIR